MLPAFSVYPEPTAMPEAIHRSVATPLQRKVAALLVTLIAFVLVATIPYAEVPLPVVAPFLPIFAAVVALTEGLTSCLLMVQFMTTRRLYLAPLAGAYIYVAVMVCIQLLVFPGVFSPTGLLGGNTQSAVWLWVFWHGGFPLLVCVAMLLRDWGRVAAINRDASARQGIGLFLGAIALALLLAYLAIRVDTLPPLIQGNNFKTLSGSVDGWAVWGVNLAAVVLVVWPQKRSQEILRLFLFVAVLASLADVSLTLLSSARYSTGWYVSRMLSIASSMSLLLALILQLSRLYRALSVSHASLLRTAARDGLTGVYNRRSFDDAAQAEWLRAQRNGEALSVVLLDVDHFKRYNDHFGHVQGDTCLRSVAQALAHTVKRPADMVARYGGEEFVMLLPGTQGDATLRIAEKARLAVAALHVPASMPGQYVSLSGGCATWHAASGYQSLDELVHAADQALYEAKAQGRNQVRAVQEPQLPVSF
jgi:diguanylate cyclase (GGDEF)-like protein